VVNRQQFSVDTAREAAEHDELADWVAEFLASPGSDNAPLAGKLAEHFRYWIGPLEVPLRQLNRLAGPEGDPVLCAIDDEEWGDNVDDMKEDIEEGWEPPPLVVSFQDGKLVLEDGNHRVEGLRRAGAEQGWAVIAFASAEERDTFAVSS
jgi:hypothetical protein